MSIQSGPGTGRRAPSIRPQLVYACVVTVLVVATLCVLIWIAGPDEAHQAALFGP